MWRTERRVRCITFTWDSLLRNKEAIDATNPELPFHLFICSSSHLQILKNLYDVLGWLIKWVSEIISLTIVLRNNEIDDLWSVLHIMTKMYTEVWGVPGSSGRLVKEGFLEEPAAERPQRVWLSQAKEDRNVMHVLHGAEKTVLGRRILCSGGYKEVLRLEQNVYGWGKLWQE